MQEIRAARCGRRGKSFADFLVSAEWLRGVCATWSRWRAASFLYFLVSRERRGGVFAALSLWRDKSFSDFLVSVGRSQETESGQCQRKNEIF